MNGIRSGSEFQVLAQHLLRDGSRLRARLLGTTWHGSDGYLIDPGEDDVAEIHALARHEREPLIQDVAHLVLRRLGDVVELVDIHDFLTTTADPLAIRYRYRRLDLGAGERAAVRAALYGCLQRRLAGRLPQGFQLVEVDSGGDDGYTN